MEGWDMGNLELNPEKIKGKRAALVSHVSIPFLLYSQRKEERKVKGKQSRMIAKKSEKITKPKKRNMNRIWKMLAWLIFTPQRKKKN